MPVHAIMPVAMPGGHMAYHPAFLDASGVPAVYAAPVAAAKARPRKTRGPAKAKKAKKKKEPSTGEHLGLDDTEGFWNAKHTPPPHDARGSLTLVAPPGSSMEGRTMNLPNINSNAFGSDLNAYRAAYNSSLNGMAQQMHAGNQANAFARSMPMAGAPDTNPFLGMKSSYYPGLAASNAHAPMNYPYPGMPPSNANHGMFLPHLQQGGMHGAVNGMNAMPPYASQAQWAAAANQVGMFGHNRMQPSMQSSMPPSMGGPAEYANTAHTMPPSTMNHPANVPNHTMPGAAVNHSLDNLQGGTPAAAPAPPQLNIAGAPADKSVSTGNGEGADNGKKEASNSSQVAINDSDILHMLKKDD